MPIIPSVFRSVRSNDVHQRPFKAFKNYVINSTSEALSEKFFIYKASHKKFPPAVGDETYGYPKNAWDGTNQHVVWKSIDHKYYRYPYDQTRSNELTNRNTVEKFLFMTASIFTIPYHEMGERIKPGTLTLKTYVTGSTTNLNNVAFDITASDDGVGNLRDYTINTGSFASSSRLQMYLTFNEQFRKFEDNRILGTTKTSDSIKYILNNKDANGTISNVKIETGVNVFVSESVYAGSGLSGFFTSSLNSYLLLPNNDSYQQLNRCDNWLLSFWIKPKNLTSSAVLISKHANKREIFWNPLTKQQQLRTVNTNMPTPGQPLNKRRTPLHISLINDELHFQSNDGTNELHISASTSYRNEWAHIAIANSASLCQIYVNGVASGTSGSIPRESVVNDANILIGTDTLKQNRGSYFDGNIAEMRLYNYEASQTHISSLANIDFYTGSLYQTNRIGNVFYRNGQIVISSPMPKYHDMLITGSAALPGPIKNKSFRLSYKGQHTIYENEVMVRVPKSTFNISTNPTSVYRPAAGIENDCNSAGGAAEAYNRPGDYIKTAFISGTLNPYITSIGLYNDKGEMLAVGKLAEPIEKRDDIDMNFIIRWDY